MLRRIALIILLVAITISVHGQDKQPITFFLTFVPNIQFAPIYVAIEKGYFAEAGIELTLEHGDEPDGVNLIAAGERQFGMISGEQVIAARANGRPVVSVYEWFQKYPIGIVVADDSGIESPADLRGRTVGIPGAFGASYTGLIALLTANELTEADIQLESIGFNAPQVFCLGGVEAAVVYVNNEPTQIERLAQRGECGAVRGVRVFNVSDYADMVSNGIITNEDTIADDPELVARFIIGFHNGVTLALNNPAEAYLMSLPYVDSLPRDPALMAALQAEADLDYDQGIGEYEEPGEGRAAVLERLRVAVPDVDWVQMEILIDTAQLWDALTPGSSDLESWQTTQDILVSMGIVSAPIDLENAFTNAFQPIG